MAKTLTDAVFDATLDAIADAGDRLFVCSAQPTNYTEASSTYALADHVMTEGDGGGDYTIANGDASGRKLTVAQQTAITVDASGTATYVAICDSVGAVLLAVSTCTSQAVTAGNTLTVEAFDIELADPT